MTTKAAIIATAVVFGVALILSIALLVMFVNPNSANANERAGQLGQGMAMLCLFPLAGIWIMWAARVRQERDKKKE